MQLSISIGEDFPNNYSNGFSTQTFTEDATFYLIRHRFEGPMELVILITRPISLIGSTTLVPPFGRMRIVATCSRSLFKASSTMDYWKNTSFLN
ncbi:hypothetical protein DEO72_LG9g1577 [Vigna unguiculata]|uniref:Uncharacterized protein n=1 Tax=Vigna unguiculata TaxID=3917 RepID=A0A4D6MYK3_VIGUN|nr:hypothetical protein DEO72_LG9g1577 [Vigna unguiculata]